MRHTASINRTALAGLMALMLSFINAPHASAADMALSNAPLFIDIGVEPNVVLTLDDSSSMNNCRVVDDGVDDDDLVISSTGALRALGSPDINKLAYDPKIEYVVPVDAFGVSLPAPSFTGAWIDGYDTGSATVDLSTSWRPCSGRTSWEGTAAPAWYALFTGSDPKSTSQFQNDSNFNVITVGNAEKQNFANWFSFYRWRYLMMKTVAARAFAHPDLGRRIRLAYTLMWGPGGHCDQPGWPGDCNGSNSGLLAPYGKDKPGPITLMKKFEGTNRQDFFTWLFATDTLGGTPLLMAMHRAGQYYMDKYLIHDSTYTNEQRYEPMNPVDSPWSFEPGVTRNPVHSCRQAFHVLMTDGGWSSSTTRAGVAGNVDNQSWTYPEQLPSGATSYSPFAPYKDNNTNGSWGYLADNAFYYWVNDLQPSLTNDVPAFMPDPTPHPVTGLVEDNPVNDPATWQHMVSFTVGFAVDGTVPQTPANYQDLLKGSANGGLDWGSDKVDDLWHAAINGRGQYLNGKNPDELANAFSAALSSVLSRTSSGASVALNSGQLGANSRLYQGRFDSGAWTGQLLAFDISAADGTVAGTESWDAGALLTTRVAGTGWDTNRQVITFDGTQGVPFRWANMTAAMQADLNKNGNSTPDAVGSEQGDKRLEWLRGSDTDETPNGNGYRARAINKLGDIINSAAVFMGDPPFMYSNSLETNAYSTFKANNTGRTPMLYVGANDGMLHAFDANTGEEKFAYVPQAIFPRLTRLTAVNYAHRFYVDGTPTVGDAYIGSSWHTVLVGGLRKGGQAIYALDVTDPSNFNEANANSIAMWEFTDANDKDLGYTFSRPAIVKLQNGQWAAVFGNGYNSTEFDGSFTTSLTGNAVLYVVNIANGSMIKKIDTGIGRAQDPLSQNRPNGLATVFPVDVDGDHLIDYIYGGDLFGNMWKFDMSSSGTGSWGVAFGGNPLFVATDGSARQPITARPDVGLHPDKNKTGFMVFFGTGKYLEPSDNITTGTQTQSFYGIWDPDDGGSASPGYTRSDLLQQQILEEKPLTVNSVTADVRLTSDNQITWAANPRSPGVGEHTGWYMDLVNTEAGNSDPKGERHVTQAILRGGRIIFTTLVPSGSSCVFGGDGWLMEIDAADGSRLPDPPFDIDGDGVFDFAKDASNQDVQPGGIRSTVGAPSAPGILDAGDGATEYKYLSGTDSGIQKQNESKDPPGPPVVKRESWQQLR